MTEKDLQTKTPSTKAPSTKGASGFPHRIGPYTIEGLLEKGGMSLLYLGTDPSTYEPVIVKVLPLEYVSRPELVDQFLNEAKIIGMTSHPNIVKLRGHGKWEGGLYIAMEFIQGISLRQFLLQQAMSTRRALEFMLQVSYAITHLHAYGVIHRDLKPENILLTSTGGVKVIDFGIAQLHTEADYEKMAGLTPYMGTPFYMSPEQRKDPSKASYSTDVYSLGLITYELVLGKPCYGVVHIALMPPGLQLILEKALQPDPKNRYQDIVDFTTAISKYLESDDVDKEMRGKDITSESFEKLQKVQGVLFPKTAPIFLHAEIGLVLDDPRGTSVLGHGFFELDDGGYVCVIAQPATPDTTGGILYSAVFRGMVAGFLSQERALTATGLASHLNHALLIDVMKQTFNFCCVILHPSKGMLSYISCGYGPLWHIPKGKSEVGRIAAYNEPLGTAIDTEFLDVTSRFDPGDTVVLTSLISVEKSAGKDVPEMGISEELLQDFLSKKAHLSPQKQVDIVARGVKRKQGRLAQGAQPFLIISAKRK